PPGQRARSRKVRCALASTMAGCLAPEKARINPVSQRPPKGARRGIGKIVLPTHSDDTWGEDAPQHAHHQHFSLREKKRPPDFGGLSLPWRTTTASIAARRGS